MQRFFSISGRVAGAILVIGLAGAPAAGQHAAGMKYDPAKHPDPAIANYYGQSKAEIDQLTSAAENSTSPVLARVSAFSQLREKYPDAAVSAAAELTKDKSSEIAALAVETLATAGVMMNHKMRSQDNSPIARHLMAKHELVMGALRSALGDDREPVRRPAAELLASQSDQIGLERIAQAAESGAYPNLEAVNYLGLADVAHASSYLSKYLDHGNEDVQAAAATYLSTSPKYALQVRDKILLNSKANLAARMAAATGLATDANVAFPLIMDRDTPPELKKRVLQVYVQTQGEKLSGPQLEFLQRNLEDIQKEQPPGSLDKLKQDVGRLYDSKSK